MDVFKFLGVSESATMDELRLKWRQIAAGNHPDRGGDPLIFDKARKAYEKAVKLIQERDNKCTCCGGKTTVNQKGLVLPCPKCKIKKG